MFAIEIEMIIFNRYFSMIIIENVHTMIQMHHIILSIRFSFDLIMTYAIL